ncbi:c-type cytochrome [Sphingomonas sp. CFBP 8760]|uniref:c-type cytochrome n=1 Tax=Sphingomonas sp. CFBP 8760 TaxID=2775282 RepID=UPI001785F0C9|nr:c-type cytochrome [Sphingomonas sp. CFBP 8760]MBD8547856.1 c-type cytochrome [Sphingomonas sp. CFBP 8760]
MSFDRLPIPFLVLGLAAGLAACGNADRDARRAAAGPDPDLPALLRVADAGAGGHAARQCLACHTFVKNGGDRAGPNLHAVMGRPIAGGSARYGYTDALSRVGGRWNPATMDRWLANPARFAPGTTMRFAGIADPLERADIIAYLETLSD